MSQWQSVFEHCLVPGERLLAVVENLSFSLHFIPNIAPTHNPSTGLAGGMALSTRRIIAVWSEGQGWKWFHIPAINSLSERPLRPDKPSWPYQAILMIPGGIGLVVQTSRPNAEHGRQLSALLVEGLVRLSTRRDDDAALAAIIAHEEEERRRREQAEEEQRRRP